MTGAEVSRAPAHLGRYAAMCCLSRVGSSVLVQTCRLTSTLIKMKDGNDKDSANSRRGWTGRGTDQQMSEAARGVHVLDPLVRLMAPMTT